MAEAELVVALAQVSSWKTTQSEQVNCNICDSLTKNSQGIEPDFITLLNSSVLKIDLNSDWSAFCQNCCKTLKNVYEIENQIKSLKKQLSHMQEVLLATIIQQFVRKCINLGSNENISSKPGQSQGKVSGPEIVKRLGSSSTGYRVYKRWRSRFTKAFIAQNLEFDKSENASDINALMVATSTDPEPNSSHIEPDIRQFQIDHDYSICAVSSLKGTSVSQSEGKRRSEETTADLIIDGKYVCPTCGQQFSRKVSLEAHIGKQHKSNPMNSNRKSICPICKVAYERDDVLQIHISEIHTRTKCQQCEICLEFYVVSANGSTNKEVHRCKKYSRVCTCCGTKFQSKSEYEGHAKNIGKVCQIPTPRIAKGRDALRRNKINSSEFRKQQRLTFRNLKHICNACKKAFATRTELSIHSRVHSGEKPVMCEICGQCFSSMSSLHSHRRTHAGIRPFKCFNCAKSFRSAGHLAKHEIIHTGAKPFICTVCQKSFNRRENLKTHQLTHGKIRPFQCPICPLLSFSRASLLKNHMIEFHGAPSADDMPPEASNAKSKSHSATAPELAKVTGENDVIPRQEVESVNYVQEAVLVSNDGGQYIVFKEVP